MNALRLTVVSLNGNVIITTNVDESTPVSDVIIQIPRPRGSRELYSLLADDCVLHASDTLKESGIEGQHVTLTAVYHSLERALIACLDVVYFSGTPISAGNECLGRYVRTNLSTSCFRPIYKGPHGFFLYYRDLAWKFGSDYCSAGVRISSWNAWLLPYQVQEWLEWDGANYVPNRTLDVQATEETDDLMTSYQCISDFREVGCSASELMEAVPQICAEELLRAGYHWNDITKGGRFAAQELKDSGMKLENLRYSFSMRELRRVFPVQDFQRIFCFTNRGHDARYLEKHGFSVRDLLAMYSVRYLKADGFSPKELADAGCSVQDLLDGGYSAARLRHFGLFVHAPKTSQPSQLRVRPDKETKVHRYVVALMAPVFLCVTSAISVPAWVAAKFMALWNAVAQRGRDWLGTKQCRNVQHSVPRRRKKQGGARRRRMSLHDTS